MSFFEYDASIRRIAQHLPFEITQTAEANRIFGQWITHQKAADKRIVDIWVYCTVHKYFVGKFVRHEYLPETDLDDLIAKATVYITEHLGQVKEASKFASWISVVCKNVFLRYFDQRKTKAMYDIADVDEAHFAVVQEPVDEREMIWKSIEKAIQKLPPTLQQVAQLKLIEQKEYAEIAVIMEKDVPTIRSYFNKVTTALRKDEEVLALCIAWLLVSIRTFGH